jgi:CDP-diacylglycerol---serine O-phosphatidyltransferase
MDLGYSAKRTLPNLCTFANMFGGFISVILTSQGNYIWATIFIAIAAIADALDGVMARLTKTSSKFGVELDSLGDVISFGFAPAFLMYTAHLYHFGYWGILAGGVFIFAGAFRLARFNVELVGFDKSYFKGLPIPTGALTVVSFEFMNQLGGNRSPVLDSVSLLLVLSVAFLMVSHVKYDTLPAISLEGIKRKPVFVLFLLVSAIAVIVSRGYATFYVFILFNIFGIIRYIFLFFRKGMHVSQP